MTKFNLTGMRGRAATSPISTEIVPSGRTYEGAPGHARNAKSELFLLAVSNMVGEDTFYESGHRTGRTFPGTGCGSVGFRSRRGRPG